MRLIFRNKILLILLVCIFTIGNAFATYKAPVPMGYVNDYANVLSAESVNKLNSIIKELQAKTGSEVVVVTLKSLDGYPIEDVGLTIGRQWEIDQKGKNNGVVILTAINDKKLRIEVGYGIEGYLTDAHAGRIRDNYMVPYFQKGDYQTGIIYGTSAVVSAIAKAHGVTISGNYAIPKANDEPDGFTILIFFLFIFLFIRYPSFMSGLLIGSMNSRGYANGGGFGGGSNFGGFGGSGGFGGGGSSGGW